MPNDDLIETVDAEPMLSVDTRLAGLPAELPAHLAAELAELLEDVERYAAAAQALNTARAYASDWSQFQAWCDRYRLESLPASAAVIGLYVTSLAKRGLALSTIRRRAAAIARAHRQAEHLPATSDPRVLTVMEGIARVHGSAPHKKTALLRDPLLELVDRIDPSATVGLRDRALLLLGFAVGLRRSELVALAVEDLSPSPDGLRIRIARSKTDQHSHHDRDRLKREIAPIQTDLRQLLEEASPKSKRTRWHRRFANNLLKVWPALWTFTTIDGVEPTNNPAERALRAPVIHRKVSLGTQSKDGERFAERALSAAATVLPTPRAPTSTSGVGMRLSSAAVAIASSTSSRISSRPASTAGGMLNPGRYGRSARSDAIATRIRTDTWDNNG
jgi:integrase